MKLIDKMTRGLPLFHHIQKPSQNDDVIQPSPVVTKKHCTRLHCLKESDFLQVLIINFNLLMNDVNYLSCLHQQSTGKNQEPIS